MLWPGPAHITQFPALPSSAKSTLAGDTVQIPEVAAYFSDNYREFVIPFYSKAYQQFTKFPFAPIRLNYPPEFSWTAIKRHTDSTYLEELVYPLRDSLFVNGFEAFYQDDTPKFWGATKFEQEGRMWDTKATLRFYPSSILARLIVWFGIILSVLWIYKLGKRL